MEKEAVADSSFIIFIAKLDAFNLVKNTFSRILLPEEVIEELFRKNSSENELIKRQLADLLVKLSVKEIRDIPLGDGEKAAISLCLEKKVKILLSDDKKARTFAKSLGLSVLGILGLLLINLKENRLNRKNFIELLNKLVGLGYYISPALYAEIMKNVEGFFQ